MIADILTTVTRVLTGVQARWAGCEPSARPRLYFANHTSNLDFVVVWAVLPPAARRNTRPVAARDYWQANPARRYFARAVFHAVLIERKHVTRETNPLPAMLQALDEGSGLILFPEGGRSLDGKILPFKGGLYHLASSRPEIELVPTYLDNLNRVLPKGEVLPVPILCSVTFGAPLRIGAGEAKSDFLTRAQAALESLRHP